MGYVDDKLKLIEEAERELFKNFDWLNLKVLAAVNKKLLQFEIKAGRFVDGTDAVVIVSELKKDIRAIIDGEDYQGRWDGWLKNYDDIVALNLKIQSAVNGVKLTASNFSDVKRAAIDNVVSSLVEEGVDANFIAPLTQGLMRNVLLGSTVTDTQHYLETYIVGDDEVQGKLVRYAGQLARDSISQFDGQLNQQIMNENDMDGFAYVGSLVDDSRPFCVHVIEDLDGFVSSEDLDELLQEYLSSQSLSRGMIDDTTPDNFAVYRGGWNCRHAAIAVFKENASKV